MQVIVGLGFDWIVRPIKFYVTTWVIFYVEKEKKEKRYWLWSVKAKKEEEVQGVIKYIGESKGLPVCGREWTSYQ